VAVLGTHLDVVSDSYLSCNVVIPKGNKRRGKKKNPRGKKNKMLQKASRTSDGSTSVIAQYRKLGSVSSPLCVCESWKGYAVKHNYVN